MLGVRDARRKRGAHFGYDRLAKIQHTRNGEPRSVAGVIVTLGERLKLVRGATTQQAFAQELGIHVNSVSNAERRDSATQDLLLRIASARGVNLHWLLTGHGQPRLGDHDDSLLQESLALALTDALRAALGARYSSTPLEFKARVIRAGATYLRAIGVTPDTLPDVDAMSRLLRLTIDVMRR
jgi:transcriptional regulator with XRE-family HTH domain